MVCGIYQVVQIGICENTFFMIKDVCFVSVAFGEEYVKQQVRLEKSIIDIHEDVPHIHFFTERLPAKARSFSDSLYGFKVHAVQEAIDLGFKKVIWVDPAMVLIDSIEYLFQYPMVAVRDTSVLHNVVSNRAAEFFGISHSEIKALGLNLVGGSFYYFDFNYDFVCDVFNLWKSAEENGMFGSQAEAASERLQGHRYDESCMALAMHKNNIESMWGQEARYYNSDNPAWDKKHFK